jgi:hypothetical protein
MTHPAIQGQTLVARGFQGGEIGPESSREPGQSREARATEHFEGVSLEVAQQDLDNSPGEGGGCDW